MTLFEVAQELGCSHASIKRRVAAGLLPVFRDGRLVRVRRVDLERYIAARTAYVAQAHGSRVPMDGAA